MKHKNISQFTVVLHDGERLRSFQPGEVFDFPYPIYDNRFQVLLPEREVPKPKRGRPKVNNDASET